MSREIVTQDGEVIDTGMALAAFEGNQPLAAVLARAEVDQQITTARAYPRNARRAMDAITSLATLDDKSAEECVYALPRAGKPIKGPSVRLAEIIAGQWGNCRIGARVIHVDKIEKYIEAEGVFHDLETNVATTARVRRKISDRQGRVYNDDMITVTGNAACSIAKRNAILGAVPKAVWRKAYDAVEAVIAGDVKTLSERREKMMKAFAAFGVKPDQLFIGLGIDNIDDVNLEHIGTLTGMYSALKSGESTVEEMFPKVAAKGDAPKGIANKLDKLADNSKPKEEAAATETAKAEPETGDDEIAAKAAEILRGLDHAPRGIDTGDDEQIIAYASGMAAFDQGVLRREIPEGFSKTGASAWQRGHDYAATQMDGEE